MKHSILPPARTQLRSTPISPRTSMLAARWPDASFFGLYKGRSVQGTICEVRDTSVRVELMYGVCGWAHDQGLNLDDDQQPCDRYREGDLVTAEVAGLDHQNECVTLSIQSSQRCSQWQHPTPMATRPHDSPLKGLQRGSHLWAQVQEVRETGVRVVGSGAPGWIDRPVAGIPEGETVANLYRAGQLISVWVTGVNHAVGEFTAQVHPLPSPPPVAGNWQEPIR